VTAGREITALLILSGTSRNLKLILQSEPALPQDEILARLLFGCGAAEITPMQALLLAMVAKSFTVGGGRQLDFISRTREFLGVDDLRFESSGDGVGQGSAGSGSTSRRVSMWISRRGSGAIRTGFPSRLN